MEVMKTDRQMKAIKIKIEIVALTRHDRCLGSRVQTCLIYRMNKAKNCRIKVKVA